MTPRIPPHIGWPLFIVALLCTSVGASFFTLFAAHSDGGAQVVEDYYEQAVRWNEAAAQHAASAALDWTAEVDVRPAAPGSSFHPVVVTLRDWQGEPAAGLRGVVQARRPHLARAVAEAPLVPVPEASGVYGAALPVTTAGLWDFEITARGDGHHFQTTVRVDVR